MTTHELGLLNWETHHDEVRNLMIHKFKNGVEVIFNRHFGTITVVKDGEPVETFDASEMLNDEYNEFLINTAKQAEAL